MENNKLFSLIQERCDPDEVLDILNMGIGELCLKLRKEILNDREKFEDFLDINIDSEYEEVYDEVD